MYEKTINDDRSENIRMYEEGNRFIVKFIYIILVFMSAVFIQAETAPSINISDYKRAVGSSNTILFMDDFNRNMKHWIHPPTVTIDKGNGINGTNALLLMRNKANRGRYEDAVVTLKPESCKFTKGKKYIFRGYYRTQGVPEKARIQTIPSVAIFCNGVVADQFFPHPFPKPAADWKKVEIKFTAGETQKIKLRLWWGIWGKAWWDDVSILEDTAKIGTMYPFAPYALHLDDHGRLTIKVHIFGEEGKKLEQYLVYVETNGKKAVTPLNAEGKAVFELGAFVNGKYRFKAMVLAPRRKLILVEDEFTLFRNSSARPVSTKVTFDANGRMLIDDRPFMPVGIFASSLPTEDDLKRIKQAGFNTVLNYRSFSMDIQAEPNEISAAADRLKTAGKDFGTPEWRKKQKRSLDLLEKHGLKLIISGMAGRYDPVYEHPVVIGYDIADENTIDQIPALRRTREKWSEKSPFRPVFALTNRPFDLSEYGKICDWVACDIYPVSNSHDGATLSGYHASIGMAHATGLPVAGIPQFFNWGYYRTSEPFARFVYPNIAEMRSQVLLDAIMGARSFLAYSYNGAWLKVKKLDPANKDKFWKDVTACVKTLRMLEPWLMSTEKAPKLGIENHGKSKIYSAAYSANNQLLVLIVSSGKGYGKAIIDIGKDGLVSATGATTALGNGKYVFKSHNIDSDILYEGKLQFPVECKTVATVEKPRPPIP